MSRKEFFDNMAEKWDERYCTADVYRILENLVAQFALKKNTSVLDAGTGTGVLLPHILKYIGDEGAVTAIDYSQRMILKARAKYSASAAVRFCVSSVEQLPIEMDVFDYVICFGAFPHFEDRPRALSEMYRVLHRGGELLIAHALGSEELKHHHKSTPEVAHDVLPEEGAMKRLMLDQGFEEVSVTDREKCYICRGRKSLSS